MNGTMSNKTDTRTLPPSALQELRGRIVRFRLQGKTNRSVAKLVGVSERHASTVWQSYLREGNEAILSRRRGRKPGQHKKMGGAQEQRVLEMLHQTPSSLGIVVELWTRSLLQEAIKRLLKIHVPIRTIGEYLKRWGISAQRPIIFNSTANSPEL
jgi:transposase